MIAELIYKYAIAFCFGAVNALIIALASSKGIEQGFLDALLGNLKKAIFFVAIIALALHIYFNYTALIINTVFWLIAAFLVNTIVFGMVLAAKWKIPSAIQLMIMQISGFISLILWYIIFYFIFR